MKSTLESTMLKNLINPNFLIGSLAILFFLACSGEEGTFSEQLDNKIPGGIFPQITIDNALLENTAAATATPTGVRAASNMHGLSLLKGMYSTTNPHPLGDLMEEFDSRLSFSYKSITVILKMLDIPMTVKKDYTGSVDISGDAYEYIISIDPAGRSMIYYKVPKPDGSKHQLYIVVWEGSEKSGTLLATGWHDATTGIENGFLYRAKVQERSDGTVGLYFDGMHDIAEAVDQLGTIPASFSSRQFVYNPSEGKAKISEASFNVNCAEYDIPNAGSASGFATYYSSDLIGLLGYVDDKKDITVDVSARAKGKHCEDQINKNKANAKASLVDKLTFAGNKKASAFSGVLNGLIKNMNSGSDLANNNDFGWADLATR